MRIVFLTLLRRERVAFTATFTSISSSDTALASLEVVLIEVGFHDEAGIGRAVLNIILKKVSYYI
jgi:hypothetical protein